MRHERRVTPSALDATRVTVCVIMGYAFALALDTWLRTLAHKLVVRTEEEFSHTLDRLLVEPPAAAWVFAGESEILTPMSEVAVDDIVGAKAGDFIAIEGIILHGIAWIDELLVTGKAEAVRKVAGDRVFADTTVTIGHIYIQVSAIPEQLMTVTLRQGLCNATEARAISQRLGETGGRKMAPRMLALFIIMLPFWEAKRAAGFLTISFGSQMAALGPYTLKNFVSLSAEHNLLILDGRALDALNLVNTIVIDARVLADHDLRAQAKSAIQTLRNRRWLMQEITPHRFAVYLLADGDEESARQLTAAVGADDYFVEPLITGRVMLIERLQMGGRIICHMGDGHEDARVLDQAMVSVAIPAATGGGVVLATESGATVVLVEKDLNRLTDLFDIAAQFADKQGVNLAWPLLMDVLDIGTTVFIHFGLVYSTLFSYSGLLVSAFNAKSPLLRFRRAARQRAETPEGRNSRSHTRQSALRDSHAASLPHDDDL